MTILEIEEKLQGILKPKRFEHTQGVRYTAAALAMKYGCDVNQAQLAGLLHDCAKNYSDQELLDFAKKNNLNITEAEHSAPQLLHAKVGALLAKQEYGVEDQEVLSAICYHTTGRDKMTKLEQIVFIADYIEPNRRMLPGLPKCRALSFSDLDQATYQIMHNTLEYLKSEKASGAIDETTQNAHDYYESLVMDRKGE